MPNDHTYRILDTIEAEMRDGCRLRANVWLPSGDGPWPVLLQRTPYGKEDAFGTQYISAMDFMAALRRGYAIAVQDTRGRFASDGEFEPFVHELEDGVDTIAWLRGQDFCNGQVVMFGGSYVGATQVLAAAGNPEGLVAISPHLTTARHGETWTWRSGTTELGFLLLWIMESLGPLDLQRREPTMPAEDARRAQYLLAEMQKNPSNAFERLPVFDEDLSRLAPYAKHWFDEAKGAQAAADQEHLPEFARTRMPALVSCGWNDLFVEGSIELFETLRARWGTPDEVPDRLIIGPWSHGNPSDWQGDFWHGYSASTIGLSAVQLDFFDAARSGTKPSSPMVRYFRSGSNTWHTAEDWPLPGARSVTYHLSGDALDPGAPVIETIRSFPSNPLDPVPTTGGANFLPGLLSGRNSAAKDQAAVEQRDDVLVYSSDPLSDGLDVTGLVEVAFWVSSTGASADWVARLCMVDRDGRSYGLVGGISRQTKASAEPVEVRVKLGHISHFFEAGTSLRLQVASSDFPRFDRNPQSGRGAPVALPEDFLPATHRVHSSPDKPSRLIISVIDEAVLAG